MERYVLLGDPLRTKEELSFATMECGGLCVTNPGTVVMQRLSADNWDTNWTVSLLRVYIVMV